MAKFSVEVNNWLNLRIIAPIAVLLELTPGLSDDEEVIDAMIDIEDAIPDYLSRWSEFWISTDYSLHRKGFDLEKWLVVADQMERLSQEIRKRVLPEK